MAAVTMFGYLIFSANYGNQFSQIVNYKQMNVFEAPIPASSPRPAARYGQTQILIDADHMLIVGGCGGPNVIFADAWVLYMPSSGHWTWREVIVCACVCV
jgi:hypothetical protein